MVATRRLTGLVDRLDSLLELHSGLPVIALSGGADSAAMAFLVARAASELRAVHVNHSLRDSGRLQTAATSIASMLDIPLRVVTVVVPAGSSPEGQARAVRYQALIEASGPGEVILTGHTLDDQSETVLLNILRGTGTRGLTGIPSWRAPNIGRPMLRITRSETRELALLAGLPYFDDPTNDETDLTRNAIRLKVMPDLLRFNPQLMSGLARMADSVRADSDALDQEAARLPVMVEGHRAEVAVGALTGVDRSVANRALASMAGKFREHASLGAEETARIWRVIYGGSVMEELAGGVVARRVGPMLRLEPPDVRVPRSAPVALGPGSHRVGDTVFEVDLVDEVCRVAPLGTWGAIFRPDAILVATADHGDVVVEVDGEPAWVPGVRRAPVAWYQPASRGYLSVSAREESGWTSSP